MSKKFVLQNGMFDCGEAALKTIFLQFGKKIEINSKFKDKGLSAYEIIKISKKNGLMAKGVKTNLSYISDKNLPCISHIIKDKNFFHYIVILKNNKFSKFLTIVDPAEGLRQISYDEFNKITTNIFILFQKTKFKKEIDNRFKKVLIKLFKKNKKIIINSIVLSIITILLSFLFSLYLKILLLYENYFVKISILFLAISIIKNVFSYIKNNLIIKFNNKIDNDINNDLITHIFMLPYSYYQKRTTGYLITIINDIENFKNIIVKISVILFVDLLFILFITVLLSILNHYYLILLILFSTLKLSISYFFSVKYNEIYVKFKSNKIKSSSYLVNVLENINSVKSLSIENKISNKIKENELQLLKEKEVFNKNNNKYLSFNLFLEDLFLICVMFISTITNINGFSLVDLVVFINIYQLLLSFLNNICEVIVMYKTYISSIEKVLDVMEEKEEVVEKIENTFENFEFNKIEYENVSHCFDDKCIFNNVTFSIEKNDSIFIEGKSGVGKTTLVKLLLKYFNNYKGKIKLDNIDLSNIKNSLIRKNIVYVSNNEKLFTDTIYNNLKLINNNDEEIERTIKICKIDEFLNKRNIDSNYIVDNLSNNLSGGEKNKILIARTLLTNAKIIIFDECFNELDSKTERCILKNIKDNYDLTIIFISHRKNNIDLFNKHYKLEEKKLINLKEEKICKI